MGVRFIPSVCFALLTLVSANACAQVAYSKGGSLVTVVPGIRDEASDGWVGTAAAIAPTSEKWVIREQGVAPYQHLTLIAPNHIITLPTNATPAMVEGAVRQISQTRDVTVIVDMKLGWNVSESGWAPHTKWATLVSKSLAESHDSAFPNGQTTYIGHSAGTEPVAMMPATIADSRTGNSGQTRRLYDDIMVLSGRRSPEDPGYPKWSVLAFADGDLYANPKGTIDSKSVLKTYGKAEAVELSKEGYSVVRILQPQSSVWTEAVLRTISPEIAAATAAAKRVAAHRESSEVTVDRSMLYYAPDAAAPVTLPTTTVASALKLAANVEAGKVTDVAKAVKEMGAHRPTEGIGGISLNATAYVPVDPGDVEFAGYLADKSAPFLELKSGKMLMLPKMDPEVLRQAYETTYKDGEKAELSISSNRATAPNGAQVLNLQAAGNFSVFYFGHSKDTLLGLVMFDADHMLGELAFTTSPAVRDVQRAIPGFRSLVELFPEKYANNPAQGRYLGSDGRVFLTPKTVVLEKSTDGKSLEFGDFGVSIHFGQTGPAESAYGAFFAAHIGEILKTQSGAAFVDLVPYARASALFQWMRDSHIEFMPGTLDRVQVNQVFTPTASPIDWGPNLADVSVQPPTTFYGLNGPTRIILGDGRESTVSYRDGKVSQVRRYDGRVLTVFRDSLGLPMAVHCDGTAAAAFLIDPKYGLVLARNVGLITGEYGVSAVLKPNSMLCPIVNPESIVSNFVMRFAQGQADL